MPKVSQSDLRKKEMVVLKNGATGDIVKVVFPNRVQVGLEGLDADYNAIFYGNIGAGVDAPTAQIHISSGSAAAGTAPIKFSPGTLLASPEGGALEYNGTDIFYTTSGGTRRNITAKPYANYYSDQIQTNTPGSESIFTYNNTAYSSYFTLISSQIVLAQYTAVYNVAFSIQFSNADSSEHIARVWLKKNGANVAATRSDITVLKSQGGSDGHAIMAANFFIQLNAGQYIELAWSATNAALTAEALPAGASPTSPLSPSVVLTINRVD